MSGVTYTDFWEDVMLDYAQWLEDSSLDGVDDDDDDS